MVAGATNGLELSALKIKDLKTVIEAGALEHKDCLDRADLERRASEAVAQTCTFVATLDLRRLEVAAKVWDARRKQDSDYESDCSDESGPPGLDTGLDGDDDGPPGLEEDGAAPPGGSAGGSAGGSDSEDSDYDSDDSDDSGPPGLEDEEERERAERAARKKAAAPAPAPAPPLSKSQAKAAKAKRQKMRKQAAFADTLKKGSKVFVTKKGVETIATVVKIHRDDPEELYVTVRDASGQERQAVRQTLLAYCREAKGAKAAKAERAARVKAAADAAERKLRAEEEQERELEKLANALGSKPLVKDKPKPKKKKPPQPSKVKENNGAKDGATASETKKGKGGATGAKDAAAASETKKGKKGAK